MNFMALLSGILWLIVFVMLATGFAAPTLVSSLIMSGLLSYFGFKWYLSGE